MNGASESSPADARREEAERALERVGREGELFASTPLPSAAERSRDHFAARDVDGADRVELWATRTGRILGLILFLVLAAWLLITYVI